MPPGHFIRRENPPAESLKHMHQVGEYSFGTRSFYRRKAVNRTGLPKFRKKEEGLEWKKFHRQGLKKRTNAQIYKELGRKEPLNLSCSNRRTKAILLKPGNKPHLGKRKANPSPKGPTPQSFFLKKEVNVIISSVLLEKHGKWDKGTRTHMPKKNP